MTQEAATRNADEIIALLGLRPHPEGGHFIEVFRDEPASGGRAHSTAIYFLLKAGESSHWHRVDATECWHFYAGGPLRLRIVQDGRATEHILGTDLSAGQRPLGIVPPGAWQAAAPLGAWTLVGCTVAPGFDFDTFELAPPGWTPPGAST